MKKYIILAMLLSVNLNSFLKAEDIEADQNVINRKTIRTEYSLAGAVYNDLDNMLYMNSEQKNDLTYNSDMSQVEKGINYLKNLARFPSDKLHYQPKAIERSAHFHLIFAGLSFMNGENGLPKNPAYGVEILKFYIHYMHPICEKRAVQNLFPLMLEKAGKFDSNEFFKKLIAIKTSIQQEERERMRHVSVPLFGAYGY